EIPARSTAGIPPPFRRWLLRPVAIGRVQIALVEIRWLDDVQVAVEDAEAGFAHVWLLPEWSAMICATHAVTRTPVGRCRNSLGPWAFEPGPIAPVIMNWACGKRSPSMLMNGIDPPRPANMAGLPKYVADARWIDSSSFESVAGAFHPLPASP